MKNRKELLTILGVGLCGGILLTFATQYFFANYRLRTPIVFQTPIVKRVLMPTPIKAIDIEPLPQNATKSATLTPTPTKIPKRTFIPIVQASENTKPITIGPKSYIIDKIKAVFGKDGDTAVLVAMSESGLRYNAQNSCCSGLFQIHRVHAAKYVGEDIFDVDVNIRVAKQIFDAQGWGPWEVCTKGIVQCGI